MCVNLYVYVCEDHWVSLIVIYLASRLWHYYYMYTQLDYYFIILPFSSPHTPSSRTLVVCDLHALETTCFGMLSPLFLVVLEQHRDRDRDPAQPYNAAYPLLKPRNPNWTNNNYALTHREAYLSVYAFPLQLSSTRLWVLFVCQLRIIFAIEIQIQIRLRTAYFFQMPMSKFGTFIVSFVVVTPSCCCWYVCA